MSHQIIRSIPFASRVTGKHARDILARDKARAQKILAGVNPHGPGGAQSFARSRGGRGGNTGGSVDAGSDANGVDVTDAGVTYTASVGVGNPPTDYTLLIDTGR